MKAIKLPKEVAPFLAVAETDDEETLVFTQKKKPVAALVSLRKADRESLALSTEEAEPLSRGETIEHNSMPDALARMRR